MAKKSGFLFLFFLLPILLFFFFKFFGKNEFKVPFYYIEKPNDIPASCSIEYHFPYQIPVASRLNIQGITVISFMSGLDSAQYQEVLFQRSKLLTQEKINWITVQIGDAIPSSTDHTIWLDSASYNIEKKCYYLSNLYSMVLVDEDRKIRGYYNVTLLKELDRLIIELSILLKAQ